mgnify:CR=1 FL=1
MPKGMWVEKATSSRSSCKKCHATIQTGEWRVGFAKQFRNFIGAGYYCKTCGRAKLVEEIERLKRELERIDAQVNVNQTLGGGEHASSGGSQNQE